MKKKIFFVIGLLVILVVTAFLLYQVTIIKLETSRRLARGASSNAALYPDTAEKIKGETEKDLFVLAALYEQRGDLLKARETYQKIVEKFPNANDIQKAQDGLEGTNIKILFSPIATSTSFTCIVQKGDTLGKIAKKFGTTKELILRANNIRDAKLIVIGKKLKIAREHFSIAVDKSQNILTLKSDGNIVKTYRVSTGANNSTPIGTFKIVNKVIDPPWYTAGGVIPPGDPKNILGSRWLGLSLPSYGIHGTTEPESIGKQVTSGCVRMKNSDVEELYSIVPEGIEVVIVD